MIAADVPLGSIVGAYITKFRIAVRARSAFDEHEVLIKFNSVKIITTSSIIAVGAYMTCQTGPHGGWDGGGGRGSAWFVEARGGCLENRKRH